MKRHALIIPILLTVMFLSTAGKENQKTIFEIPKFSTTVQLNIGPDEEVKNDVYSYISRELRSLGDVQVVKDKADYFLNIYARQIKGEPEGPISFILSMVILRPFRLHCDTLKLFSEGRINEKDCQMLEKMYADTYWFKENVVGSGSNLQFLCQKIVTFFDAEHLKPDRERHQDLWKGMQQQWQSMSEAEKKSLMMNENEKKELTIREMVEKKKAEAKQKQ